MQNSQSGWGGRSRTLTYGTRNRCPTIRRHPSASAFAGGYCNKKNLKREDYANDCAGKYPNGGVKFFEGLDVRKNEHHEKQNNRPWFYETEKLGKFAAGKRGEFFRIKNCKLDDCPGCAKQKGYGSWAKARHNCQPDLAFIKTVFELGDYSNNHDGGADKTCNAGNDAQGARRQKPNTARDISADRARNATCKRNNVG